MELPKPRKASSDLSTCTEHLPRTEDGPEDKGSTFYTQELAPFNRKGCHWKEFDGKQAAWVTKKYHGHCILPESPFKDMEMVK